MARQGTGCIAEVSAALKHGRRASKYLRQRKIGLTSSFLSEAHSRGQLNLSHDNRIDPLIGVVSRPNCLLKSPLLNTLTMAIYFNMNLGGDT